MSNPRKPSHLHAIQGTERAGRTNLNEPDASPDLPTAPEYLNAAQAEKFVSLVAILTGMRIASADNVGPIADLAVVECEIADDTVLLATEGPYYVPSKESGIIRAHPAVARLTANRQRAQALRGEFGLTPSSKSKVSASPERRDNPYALLEKKHKMRNSGDKYD